MTKGSENPIHHDNLQENSQTQDQCPMKQETVPPVTVSMKKLTAGVTTIFAGIVQMLEALEPQVAQQLVDIAVQNGGGDAPNTKQTDTTGGDEAMSFTEIVDTADVCTVDSGEACESVEARNDDSGVPVPAELDDSVSANSLEGGHEVKQENIASSTVTEDDITKIIVRKIKQDRSNNEKIGAILRTYGVAKVSELPASKYEAFLADVSQL